MITPLPAAAAKGDNATIDTCLSGDWHQRSFRGGDGHRQQAGYATKAGACSAGPGTFGRLTSAAHTRGRGHKCDGIVVQLVERTV